MKLLTHAKIPAERLAALQSAVDAVETAMEAIAHYGEDLHDAAHRYPNEKNKPEDALDVPRWEARREKRGLLVDFAGVCIHQAEHRLKEANEQLGHEVEQFRQVADSLNALPYEQRDDDAAYFAGYNLLYCDALCSLVIDYRGYDQWPKASLERRRPDAFGMRRLVEANRRGFTYRHKTGKSEWQYFQDRFSHWCHPKLPTAPCLTQQEAELGAKYFARVLANSMTPEHEFTVEVWDIDNARPSGRSITGRGQDENPESHGVRGVCL